VGFLASALLAAGCRRVPSPPYARAFSFDGHTPRLLYSAQETTVPLAISNTGTAAWDPARVHVSYHWLWLVPRELAARSRWDVPYQEGIRTDLPTAVTPGARTRVEGRLLAPSTPGIYWLQWDMVEEGVAWFAQTSPRQPRQLVLVRPTLAAMFAPLPLLVALGGILALGFLGRGRRPAPLVVAFIAAADIVWCAATLLSKQLRLVSEALLEPTAVAYWLTVIAAVGPPLVLMLVLPRRARAWVLLACGAFGTLVVLGDVIYYRFFGDVMSAPALLAAHQTGRVVGTIGSLLTPGLLWLVIDVPFAAWLIVGLHRLSPAEWLPRRAQPVIAACAAVALAAVGGLLSAPRVLASSQLDQMFRNRAVVEQLGPFGFHAYDAWTYVRGTLLRPPVTDAQVADARAWFAGRAALRAGAGPSFGAARGKNLIVIQVESLQDLVVDYRVGGQDVMPHLRRWTDDSLRFTNVTDQTNEGRTSDAEFAGLVSLLPLDHGAAAFRYSGNHYVGLPQVLGSHGYRTLSAVPFEPGFWNRRVMHRAYGFQQSLFEPDFTMTEQIGWGLNDRDFLQQMVPRLAALPRPFCAWLITLSLHHPFKNFPDRHKTLTLGALEGTSFGNFLHTMRFFDQALEEFKVALERDRLLDDTLVVVFGDHDAGFPRDAGTEDEAAWALKDRVPLFIRAPAGSAEALRGSRPIAAGHTDFAPTLLALLGIDPAPLPYMGRNLLGAPDDPPVLRPYGDWLDSRRLFIGRSGDRARECYDIAARSFTAPGACDESNASARKAREVARLVIADDLQQRLYTAASGAR
jgi:phosphoglycerol transferase MdoB-like AlkP superfamily enzyme